MIQLIALIVFLISLSVVIAILYKKFPLLLDLPNHGHHGFAKPLMIAKIEDYAKKRYVDFFKKQMLLHKSLSFLKVQILKIETKIDYILHGIRKNTQELTKKDKKK